VVAQADPVSETRKSRRRHERRLHFGLLSLLKLRELAEQHVGHDETEHGIAQELERLVVEHSATGVFVRARFVRQRMFEKAAVAKAVVDPLLQRFELLPDGNDDGTWRIRPVRCDQAL
jgi:hypothetical protein